ncbi:hypothetical protein KAR91_76290 [Candidatus Pacearchaeota archaeon]|nr:hypothetical protein [Candidatus Pacearchaeota archaeon]
MTRKEKLIDDMKILCGIPPHDVESNFCQGDGYFSRDLKKRIKYSNWSWDDIHKLAVEEGRKVKPQWDR